jgi:hypothetical protein
MTTSELINYYANLLILQYIGKPKAYATIQAIVGPVIMNQLPLAVQNAFNMDGTAVGVQLDVLGKYAGVTRNGYGLTGQPITLDDTDFFTLIKLAILTNSAGSDLNTIQSLIAIYFPGELFVFDHKEMRMSYYINSSVGSQNLIELFITEGLLPKPMGVQLAAPIYSAPLEFFGMVDAQDVVAYAAQNSVSINAAAIAVATADNIYPFNDATAPTTGVWLDSELGVSIG